MMKYRLLNERFDGFTRSEAVNNPIGIATAVVILYALMTSPPISAQDYTLDSVPVTTRPAVVRSDSEQPTYVSKSKSDFGANLRSLFGIGFQGMYMYEKGNNNLRVDSYNIPTDEYLIQDAILKIEWFTPIFNFSQSLSYNTFTNSEIDRYRYFKTHIDFLGIEGLGAYYEKRNGGNARETALKMERWLPLFDYYQIKSANYKLSDIRIGGIFYNLVSLSNRKVDADQLEILVDGMHYGLKTVSDYWRLSIIDMRGFLDYYRLRSFNHHRNNVLHGYKYEDQRYRNWVSRLLEVDVTIHEPKKEPRQARINMPFPYINAGFDWGKVVISKEGIPVVASDSKRLFCEVGIKYIDQFYLSKHVVLIPEFMWQFMDFGEPFEASKTTVFMRELEKPSFIFPHFLHAGLSLQIIY